MLFRSIELSPREVRPHNGLAELYEQLGRLDSAREQYRRSLQMDPWQPSAHYNLANLLANTDAAAAERHYRACLQIDPSHVRAWTNLANLLLHQGDVRGAIEAYTQALQQDPNLLEALQNRAVALGANGDRVGARRDYESVLRLATSAHREIGRAHV